MRLARVLAVGALLSVATPVRAQTNWDYFGQQLLSEIIVGTVRGAMGGQSGYGYYAQGMARGFDGGISPRGFGNAYGGYDPYGLQNTGRLQQGYGGTGFFVQQRRDGYVDIYDARTGQYVGIGQIAR